MHISRKLMIPFLVLCLAFDTSYAEQKADVEALRKELDAFQQQGQLTDALDRADKLSAAVSDVFGATSPEFAAILSRRSGLLQALGRYTEAEKSFLDARTAAEAAFGIEHVNVSFVLNDLALLYKQTGRYAESDKLYQKALAIRETALGSEHPAVGLIISNQAALYVTQGRFKDAEPLFKRAIAINEKALKPDDPEIGRSLNNLATLYWAEGKFSDAEPLFKRSLAIIESRFGPEHPALGAGLNNLAALYQDQGRPDEAEPLFRRSLDLREKALGAMHREVGESANALAWFYHKAVNRLADAEPLYVRAISVTEAALGPEHATVGAMRNNLAVLYYDQKRYAEAEPLFQQAIAIRTKALGIRHSDVGQSMYRLACLYQDQGRLQEAIELHEDALDIRIKSLGPQHPDVVQSLDSVADLFERQKDWANTVDIARRARDIVIARSRSGALSGVAATQESGRREIAQGRRVFSRLVRTLWWLSKQRPQLAGEALAEAFLAANWADQTEAGTALAQMSLRQAKGTGRLAGLIRDRQDLASRWQVLDRQLYASLARGTGDRSSETEAHTRAELGEIEARRADIDETVKKEFPDFFELSQPEPMSVKSTQKSLRPNEALLQYMVSDNDVFVWAVTRTGVRWARSNLAPATLTAHVAAIRCGLDGTAWAEPNCMKRLKIEPLEEIVDNERFPVLPFEASLAHELYAELVQPFEKMLEGKRLLIVPAGALTSLPYHVLVTKRPAKPLLTALKEFRDISWLGLKSAMTVLPTASSLRALRQYSKAGAGSKAYIGFGNPELDGSDPDLARAARERQTCRDIPQQRVSVAARGKTPPVALTAVLRSGAADVAYLRQQSPLPETADELCDVAKGLGVSDDEVKLGQAATETAIKDLSDSGALAQYRILHFATHGALAGQVVGNAEPGLILTPPKTGDPAALERDDGYLSASEVASLKLDADWVILSACNTAAAGGTTSEALSGLARAFFYSGSRSLLVSHWEVSSVAAVKLTTRALALMKNEKSRSRSEAMRLSMRELMSKGSKVDVHPSQWAPFVVVGEGN